MGSLLIHPSTFCPLSRHLNASHEPGIGLDVADLKNHNPFLQGLGQDRNISGETSSRENVIQGLGEVSVRRQGGHPGGSGVA